MKYKVIWISLLLVVCIVGGFFANQKLMENRYRQITQEFFAYQEAERTSYTEALDHYMNAKKLIYKFGRRYTSDTFYSMMNSDKKNTNWFYVFQDFQKLEPSLTSKSKAENNLTESALLVAKNIWIGFNSWIDYGDLDIKDQMSIDVLGVDPSDPFNRNDESYPISNIANLYANAGKYEQARMVLRFLDKDPKENLYRIGLLVTKAIKANKKEEATLLLKNVVKDLKKPELEIWKQVNGLYLIAEGCRLLGQNKEYFQVIESLILSSDRDTYHDASDEFQSYLFPTVDHLTYLNNKELALKVLDFSLLPFKSSSAEEYIKIEYKDLEFLAKIVHRLFAFNRPDLAEKALQSLKKNNEKSMVYTAFANLYFKDQPVKVRELLQNAKKLIGLTDKAEFKIEPSLKLADIYFENKMNQEAMIEIYESLRYSQEINNPNYKIVSSHPLSYWDVLETLVSHNRIDDALALSNKNLEGDEKASALSMIARYYLKNGKIDKAIEVSYQIIGESIHRGYYTNFKQSIDSEIAEKYLETKNIAKALFFIQNANVEDKAIFFNQLTEDFIKSKQISKAKEYLHKSFALYKKGVNEFHPDSQEWILDSIIIQSAKLDDEALIIDILNFSFGDKDSKLIDIAVEYAKQNNVEKFLKYFSLIKGGFSKNEVLTKVISQELPEKIKDLAYTEAVKIDSDEATSLYLFNQAKQLIEQKEYEKALAMVEKIYLDYYKATILTLLAIHWEKPNLSGANREIMHRIVAGCQ